MISEVSELSGPDWMEKRKCTLWVETFFLRTFISISSSSPIPCLRHTSLQNTPNNWPTGAYRCQCHVAHLLLYFWCFSYKVAASDKSSKSSNSSNSNWRSEHTYCLPGHNWTNQNKAPSSSFKLEFPVDATIELDLSLSRCASIYVAQN